MNLDQPTKENIEHVVLGIAKQLAVVNASLLKPEHFGPESYEELLEIYEWVQKKKLTMSELDAILVELGKLRKK